MTVIIKGSGLTIEDVVGVARHGDKIELHKEAVEKINKCREMLENKIAAGEAIYGVNTGIGELANVPLKPDQVKDFQRYLIISHSAGIGEPMPVECVRAGLLSRINVHAHGNSGCRSMVTQTLVEMLNKGVTPVVCEKGSVGACGDLAPMSQATLVLMGMGEAFYKDEKLPGGEAMKRAGIALVDMDVRDGLALINGSNLICGIAALEISDTEKWLKQAEIAATMSLEALKANMLPYEEMIHMLRGFKGAVSSAANIRKIASGSDLYKMEKVKLQDSYSMRSTPQVLGAVRDFLRWAREQVEIELNGVADNPVFVPDENKILTGANFQGTPVAMPMEMVGSSVTMASVLSERRLNRLLNPALSAGLPPFLAGEPGIHSGMMLCQYTADMLIVEQKILSTPAHIQSIPASADQEDFVSMGMNTVQKTRQILDNGCGVIGIELLCSARALELRDYKLGIGTRSALKAVRSFVPDLDINRPLYLDHNVMKQAVKSGRLLEMVESEIGQLNAY